MNGRKYEAPIAANNRHTSQTNNLTRLPVDSTPDQDIGEVEGYEFVEEGSYSVEYDRHEFLNYQGGRICIWFTIIDGEYGGEQIPYFCKVKILNIKTGHHKCRKGSKYYKTMAKLTQRP